jgi:hypothetical protein
MLSAPLMLAVAHPVAAAAAAAVVMASMLQALTVTLSIVHWHT